MKSKQKKKVEIIQQEHYDKIAEEYEKHYNDKYSRRYYWEFFCEPLFDDFHLTRKSILDAMCGTGEMTSYLLSRGAIVIGLDISSKVMERYSNKWIFCPAVQGSILDTKFPDNSFDAVVVSAGLHHTQPKVNIAIEEIHRILKPKGSLFFIEPHKSSFYSILRKLWYRGDKIFGENEESIDLEELKGTFGGKFEFIKEKYTGNIAYFLVWNSLIFRIPTKIKPYYSPALIIIEAILSPFMFKWTSASVMCHWRKK